MRAHHTPTQVWSCTLCPRPDDVHAIEATFAAFAEGTDEVVRVGLRDGTTSNGRLHAACYRSLRDWHGLKANLAIRVVAHGAGRLRRGETGPMTPDVINFDARVLTVSQDGETVSLTTVQGRLRGVPVCYLEGPSEVDRVVRAQLLREPGPKGVGTYRLTADVLTIDSGRTEHRQPRLGRAGAASRLSALLLMLWGTAVVGASAQTTPTQSGDGVYVPPPADPNNSPFLTPGYGTPTASLGADTYSPLASAATVPGRAVIDIDYSTLPPAALRTISVLNVNGADLRATLRALAAEHSLGLVIDGNIRGTVTASLSGVRLIDALVTLANQNGLSLRQVGDVFQIGPPALTVAPPLEIGVEATGGTLTLDVSGVPLSALARAVSNAAGVSIVVRQGVEGQVSGSLREAPFEGGLRTLLTGNGFSLANQGGVWTVDRINGQSSQPVYSTGPSPGVQVGADGRVSIDVAGVPIADVLREIVAKAGLELVLYQVPEGTVTARVTGLSIDEALGVVLRRSNATYHREGNAFVIGMPDVGGVESRLLRLGHLRAESAFEMIPDALKEGASVQLVPEQNGVVVTGHIASISAISRFLASIDLPSPLILIEALVIDFEDTDLYELGLSAGFGADAAASAHGGRPRFGGETGTDDGIRMSGDGRGVTRVIQGVADLFGVGSIGRLPDDFYLRIRALERDGRVRVRSRPQISTINGHTASISVGTTQYYILRTNTPIGSTGGDVYPVQTERFEKIEANVRLEITPYVTATGEVTAVIKPEFSTPVGQLDPETPPTINTRVLQSTVRLRDGETIILGGLIQEGSSRTYNKVPLLGSIPLLGRLFRSESTTSRSTELVIYLTPHVFYGDADDAARWTRLREDLNLSGEEVGTPTPRRSVFDH